MKTFCRLKEQIQSKLFKLTCNLWTSQLQVSKLVAIEFACSSGNFFFKFANGKTFTQLQMDIFCQSDFCHNRKNAFRKDTG